ncbi:MAG TPA: polysaccharide biosynthesis C-terminal domain-containing protein [Actinomycetota bacterium]|nr:polysaccharide biosynthesis C-terminal domain-containing protein [Actinomycetota bacterium]
MSSTDLEVKRLGSASASIATATAGAAFLSFVFVTLVARIGGAEARGKLAFLVALPTLLSFAATLGIEVTNLFHAGRQETRSSLVTASLVVGASTGVVFAGGAWLLFQVVPGWVPDGISGRLVASALTMTPVMTVQYVLGALLVGCGREGAANMIRVIMPAISVVIFFVSMAQLSVATSAVAAWIIGQIVGAVYAVVMSVRAFGLVRPSQMVLSVRELLRYGLPAHGGNLADVATFRLDSLILAATVGTIELGIYAVAINLAEVLLYVPASVAMVLLSTSAASDDSTVLAVRAAVTATAISSVGAVAMIVLAPWVVRALFGPGFEASVLPLRILSVAMIGMGLRRVLTAELAARRRQALAAWVAVVTLAVIATLDVTLIPRFGAEGAAWASLVAYLLGGGLIVIAFLRTQRPTSLPSPG